MAEPQDVLLHVRQRLDALTSDDPSQLFLSVSFPPRSAPNVTNKRSWLVRHAGLSAFYVRLVLLLGTGWLFAMVGIFTFLYALPAAQEDFVLTSTAQVILLLAMYFLGGAAGCLLFGACADHYGRRPVLLSAMSFWVVINALTAGAWNYASFVTLRLLAGMGIGGQLALLVTLSIEYAPTRTRGCITILTISVAGLGVFGGVGYGQLAGVSPGNGGLGWRATYGMLSAAAVLFVAVLYLALEESPKYLASVGRTEQALSVLEKIETAHGVNHQVRVTVPTNLYEPPNQSQRPLVNYQQYLESSSDSESDFELDLQRGERERNSNYNYTGPGAAKARSQSQRASTRRLQSQHQHQVEVCTPNSGDLLGTPSDTPATDTDVSFLRGLTRRVAILFSRTLAGRTVLILFFWFMELTCLSASIVTALMMAGTFIKVNALGTGYGVSDQLFWSAMTFPGLLLAALMVETVGRRGTLVVFVFCGGAALMLAGLMLEEDGEWLGLSLALGVMVFTTSGTIGAITLFTGEQFPLSTRALGLSCAAGWGHLGMFAGVYLVLRRVMGDEAWTWHDERMMLAICGAVSIVLIPIIFFMGPETRGRDIDTLCFQGTKTQAGGGLSMARSSLHEHPTTSFCGVSKVSNIKDIRKLKNEGSDTLHLDDIDLLASAGTEHGYRQHRRSLDCPEDTQLQRQSVLEMLEPVLLEWRRSLSSSLSSSVRDLSSSSKHGHRTSSMSRDMTSDLPASDVRSSATGRYTIDLDMFDTFTYISTPVLGGDNCSEHEHRELSNLSSASSGEVKQTSC